MVPVLHPKLAHIYQLVELSNRLEKIATDYRDDSEVLNKTLRAKLSVDNRAFELIKEAVNWSVLKPLAKPVAWGVGVGAPLTLGGSYLINRFYRKGEEATSDVRDKILQTALGLAAIGGGLYGLHRLTGGAPIGGYPPTNQTKKSSTENKTAAANLLSEDAVEKLATVGIIEGMLTNLPASTSEDVLKLAAEVRFLNRGYGMRLLYELSHGYR